MPLLFACTRLGGGRQRRGQGALPLTPDGNDGGNWNVLLCRLGLCGRLGLCLHLRKLVRCRARGSGGGGGVLLRLPCCSRLGLLCGRLSLRNSRRCLGLRDPLRLEGGSLGICCRSGLLLALGLDRLRWVDLRAALQSLGRQEEKGGGGLRHCRSNGDTYFWRSALPKGAR